MDLEETKKIIRNKIEADETACEVGSQIKTYIHEKQNLREGFKETFKPLIETSEALKTSIDTQQNKLIKQLQDNQLALTEGLDKNRLAITSGFDKMDEVKKLDLQQLPGFEAIEEPEKEELEKKPYESELRDTDFYNITHRNLNKLIGEKIYPDDDEKEIMTVKDISKIYRKSPFVTRLRFNHSTKEVFIDDDKPKISTVTYGKEQMNKYLNNKQSVDLLNSYGLNLPDEYKNKSLEEFQEAFDKGLNVSANYRKSIENVAKYKKDSITGMVLAFPKAGENAREKTKELIKEHNILQIFVKNMREIRNYKQLTGTGIIHFNNPQQLVDRLELLAGSILLETVV